MNEEVRHFSLRKLSVGLASVLVGVSIFGASQMVKADTVADQTASAVTGSMQNSDTQENGNAAESTFSNVNRVDNAKSNATQTQENEPKQVQAENVQHDSAPETQETTDNKDLGAEKGIVHTSSLQEPDNQSNTVTGKTVQHNALESGQKTQSFNLPKNSQKFNRKVLATNLIATSPMTNGGFDEATWGKLDVNDWQGSAQDGVYQLTDYTGDPSHIIVPNEADFEKAGKSTNGLQVGITRDTVHSFLSNRAQTIAFSKTKGEKVKAIGTDWSWAFSSSALSKFDGSSLDVSNVTDMNSMFGGMFMFTNNSISDLTSLANWNTSKVTDMSYMFNKNEISDLRPLSNWDVSNVTNMRCMLTGNKISDLSPLTNWSVNNVTDMRSMFSDNKISDLSPLTNWSVNNVTDMRGMFSDNKISDLTPLTNWNVSNVTNMSGMFGNSKREYMPDRSVVFIDGNKISDLAPLTNWNVSNVTNMGAMFARNSISDLAPLTNWNVSNVTNMSEMFEGNSISNLASLSNWDVSKVTGMSGIFTNNPDLIDLKPIANWNLSSVIPWHFSGLFKGDTKLDLTNINNTPLMQSFLKVSIALQSTAFITNNAHLVEVIMGKDMDQALPVFTNTATRTIVFNFPDGTSKTVTQTIYYEAIAPVQIYWPAPPVGTSMMAFVSRGTLVPYGPDNPTLVPYDPDNPNQATPDSPNPVDPYSPKIIKTYPVKDPDWQLDTSKTDPKDAIIANGQVYFKPVPIPHINGYKAHFVRNPLNHAMLMVSFMAVPTENKPSTPVEVAPSKPSAPVDNPSKPSAPVDNPNKPADDLQKHVAAKLNSNDLGWTMPVDISNSTYTVEVPKDATIDLSDLVIAEPVHTQTRVKITVSKRFKLRKHNKKHAIKHLKHRKRVSKLFSKRYASL